MVEKKKQKTRIQHAKQEQNQEKLHKCRFRGCQKMIREQYVLCYDHRDAKYRDVCKKHGKVLFQHGRCLQCQQDQEQLKESIYSLTVRDNKIYMNGVLVTRKNKRFAYLFPWVEKLAFLKPGQVRFGRIRDVAGVYGVIDRHTGDFMYIGQSFHVDRRRQQHLDNVKLAKKQHVNRCYDWMAQHPKDWKFVLLYHFPREQFNKLTLTERKKLLCVAEQWGFDNFHPRFNVIASRKSVVDKRFKG